MTLRAWALNATLKRGDEAPSTGAMTAKAFAAYDFSTLTARRAKASALLAEPRRADQQ